MEKILGWSLKEVKELFNSVNYSAKGDLKKAFTAFAKKHRRNIYSVRNYYYQVVKCYNSDERIKQEMNACGINLDAVKLQRFTEQEEVKLLTSLLNFEGNISLKNASLNFAQGDSKAAIKYQNKYRNLIKYKPELVRQVKTALEEKNIRTRSVKLDNIYYMPKENDKITDSEIQALFNGLVKLVRRDTETEFENKFKTEKNLYSSRLKNALIDVRRQEVLLDELHAENKKLEARLEKTEKQLIEQRMKQLNDIMQLKDLVNSSKLKELKSFLTNLARKDAKINENG